MDLITLSFLIPLGIIGVLCSYTDLKYGKIPNKLIGVGFVYGIFLFLSLFIYDRFSFQNPENIRYLSESAINGFLALLAGFGLWHFKLWSAGDGKLFALYAFLVPLKFYSNVYISYFPSFNLLVNLFFPLLIILMIAALFTVIKERGQISKNLFRKENWTFVKLKIRAKIIAKMFIDYVFIIIIIQNIIKIGGKLIGSDVQFNPFIIYFILLLIMRQFSHIRSKDKRVEVGVYLIIFSYSIFLILNGNIISLEMIAKTAITFMILIGFTRSVLDLYVSRRETLEVRVGDLKKGMIPSKSFIRFLSDKIRIFKDGAEMSSFQWIDASGFNEKQVKVIKEIFADDQDYKIETYRTFPFAPFLFLSALISIITQNSFLILLEKIFLYIVN